MRKALRAVLRIALGAGAVWCIYLLRGRWSLRLYPVAMSLLAFAVFAVSLFRTPVAEIFARRMDPALDARGVRYCRKATAAWAVFLACNTLAAAATLFMPLKIWALYNGCLSYILMGAMFLGEYIARRKVLRAGLR